MKTTNTVLSGIIAVTPSKWIQAALMTLALFAATLVVTGCDRSDDSDHRDSDHRDSDHRDSDHRDSDHRDSDHHMNHGNQMHPSGGKN